MSYHPCGACKGSGFHIGQNRKGQIFHNTCRVCGGNGQDNRWRSKSCHGCYATIDYRNDWSNIPEYCHSCRTTQLTKNCGQPGCSHTIRYKRSWISIPTYCKRCEEKRSQGCTAGICAICGTITWSPLGKMYIYCRDHAPKRNSFGGESNKKLPDGRIHTTRYLDTGLRHSWDHDGNNQNISGDHYVDQDLPVGHPHRKTFPKKD